MKTTAELRSLFSLSRDDIGNFRKSDYLHPIVKRHGEYLFSERDRFLLQYAVPDWRKGFKISVAFDNARKQYDAISTQIRDVIFELQEAAEGRSPTIRDVERRLSNVDDITEIIQALVEQKQLLKDSTGRLSPLPLSIQPKEEMGDLAYTPGDPGWITLPEERKLELRELAVSIYLTQIRSNAVEKIPVPVDPLLVEEHIGVQYVNLGEAFGHCSPAERIIYLSPTLRKKPERRRLVLMHEYFHIKLGHQKNGQCSEDQTADLIEREANYASLHYLIPMHTFDLVGRTCSENGATRDGWLRKVASRYEVPVKTVSEYQREYSMMQRLQQ